MKVALTFYVPGAEESVFTDMPAVPCVGDRLHAPEQVPLERPLRSFRVESVTWVRLVARDDPDVYEWVPEVALSQ